MSLNKSFFYKVIRQMMILWCGQRIRSLLGA
jgi:hypothetical protein